MKNKETIVLKTIQNYVKGNLMQSEALIEMWEFEARGFKTGKTDLWLTGYAAGLHSASSFIDLMIERLGKMNDNE